MQKLSANVSIETVTYCGDGVLPELSGYGETVAVVISANLEVNKDVILDTVTVKIGGVEFLPNQLEDIVKGINLFKESLKVYTK